MAISSKLKKQILDYLKLPIPQNKNMKIVERSVPVPFFGNIENACVATISINPSLFIGASCYIQNFYGLDLEDLRSKLKKFK